MNGRLYWKRSNWRWRNFFDSDDVAVWRDGTMSMHFKEWSAIEEFIEYCEWVTNDHRTN
jgi:hypothetical protein